MCKVFINLWNKFDGQAELDKKLLDHNHYGAFSSFKCCKNCKRISDKFCKLHYQLEVLDLKLNSKLNEAVENLEFASKVFRVKVTSK